MRIMFDSTSPWDIPRDAAMIAYYVDGRYAWPQEWLDMFPDAVKVSISAIGVQVAHVGDVEVGCIWPPANAVPWVRRARAAGYDPTIYVNELNDWLPVRQAFWNAGEPEPHYWTARYNGIREIPPGAVARQFAHPHDGDGFANNPWETGKHYDLSVVADYWPGVDDDGDDMAQAFDDFRDLYYRVYGDAEPNKNKTAGHVFFEMLNATLVQTRVLTDVVGRVTQNPGVTPEQVREWLDESVARHLNVTGTLTIGPAPVTETDVDRS